MTELEQQNKIMKILISYLLMERKQETQLSMAFAVLVQERHNQFHTLGDRKEGDESNFADCKNDLCASAFGILKDSRSMAVEINDLSIQLVADYQLTVQHAGNSCRAWLDEKKKVKSSSNLIIPQDSVRA